MAPMAPTGEKALVSAPPSSHLCEFICIQSAFNVIITKYAISGDLHLYLIVHLIYQPHLISFNV